MNRSTRLIITAAAISGLYAGSLASKSYGSTHHKADAKAGKVLLAKDDQKGDKSSCKGKDGCSGKHDCKGKNDCKGQGGCSSGDNGCKGKNSCKGKGGCASSDKKDA
ncbi:MAG TPA: hypothetical protein VHE13_16165 [Opitutus sp.]|nr:hypothetical protein [Opitutus sp.]